MSKVIIYNAMSKDGRIAAWCYLRSFTYNIRDELTHHFKSGHIKLVPFIGKDLQINLEECDVVLIGIGCRNEFIKDIINVAKRTTIIDNNIFTHDWLSNIDKHNVIYYSDPSRSIGQLAHDMAMPSATARFKIVDYIADEYAGISAMPWSEEVNTAIEVEKMTETLSNIDNAIKYWDTNSIASRGVYYLRAKRHYLNN